MLMLVRNAILWRGNDVWASGKGGMMLLVGAGWFDVCDCFVGFVVLR